ncbi:MAG TPA: hypothetical protein QGH84_00115 [Rhodospirillales bacterium]|jgi:hypothetical protein|nr:hypothetical protein [Rhodospirillales bacterium]
MLIRSAIIILSIIGLSACEMPELPSWAKLPSFSFGGEGAEEASSDDCKAGEAGKYRSMNWAGAKHIDIYNRQSKLTPSTVVLKANTANIIRLFNGTKGSWSFRADDFFRATAVVSVLYGENTVSAPCLEGIKIGSRKWAELRLVPLRQGEYFFGSEEPTIELPFSTPAETGKFIVR